MDRAIAMMHQPYAANRGPVYNDTSIPLCNIFSLSSLNEYHFSTAKDDAFRALLLASYALQAYHADHGRYPGTLGELSPAYLSAVPNDPFALNTPLRYTRNGTSYVLYSVGPDGIDNGGTPSADGQATTRPKLSLAESILFPESCGDMVAGVNLR
jgi:hypothetical protein